MGIQYNDLVDFGLSAEEIQIYLLALRKKSFSIHDLRVEKHFSSKQRPNLYKLLNKLENKNFIISELKQQGRIYFPIEPSSVLNQIIQQKEEDIELLKLKSIKLIEDLEQIRSLKNLDFTSPSDLLRKYVDLVPKKWNIKERPIIEDKKRYGIIHSIEFDTQRKFSGNSAGIIIHKFRYPEHIPKVFADVSDFDLQGLKNALENLKSNGIFRVKQYRFINTQYQSETLNKSYEIYECNVKMNFGIKSKGALGNFFNSQYPNEIVCFWAANYHDFAILVEYQFQRFKFSQNT